MPIAAGAIVLLVGIIGVGIGIPYYRNWDFRRRQALVSPANFDKLQVGMTLKEVEQILGPGTPSREGDRVYRDLELTALYRPNWNKGNRKAWCKAIKEGKVLFWRPAERSGDGILAAFPGIPSSDSRVEVFLRVDIGPVVQKPADRWMDDPGAKK